MTTTEPKINRALNLVIPVDTDSGARVFVHATPISRAVFELYYDIIGIAFRRLMEGAGIVAGPSLAFLELRSVATKAGRWEGPGQVKEGLMAEIERLANVQVSGPNGWQSVPLAVVTQRKMLDEETLADIMGQLCFFTCVAMTAPKADRAGMLESVGGLWGSLVTSLDCTAHRNSLPTLKPELPEPTAPVSVIPS